MANLFFQYEKVMIPFFCPLVLSCFALMQFMMFSTAGTESTKWNHVILELAVIPRGCPL